MIEYLFCCFLGLCSCDKEQPNPLDGQDGKPGIIKGEDGQEGKDAP